MSTDDVMTTVVEPPAGRHARPCAATPVFAPLRPAYCLLVAPVAVVLAVAGAIVALGDDPLPVELVRPVIVALWAAAGLALGIRRRHDRLAPIVLGGAVVGGAGTLAAAMLEHRTLDGAAAPFWDLALRLSAALLPAIAMHLLFGLADGRLATLDPAARRRRRLHRRGHASALALMADRDRLVMLADRRAVGAGPRVRPARQPRPLRQGRRRSTAGACSGSAGAWPWPPRRRSSSSPCACSPTGRTTPAPSPSPSPG